MYKNIIYTSNVGVRLVACSVISLFLFTSQVFAITNTQSIDLEKSSSQYLSISDASQTGLDITGDISIEAWVKLEQLPSTTGHDMFIAGKTDGTSRSYEFMITPANNKLAFQFTHNGSTWSARDTSSAAFTSVDVGKWVHVAVTASVASGGAGIKIYRNGELLSSGQQANNSTSILDSGAQFAVGRGNISNGHLDGLIDEVRVWSDVRTEAEIQDNYLETLTGSESNLVAYWEFSATSTDKTSNNNDLVLNGSPSYSEEIPFVVECTMPDSSFYSFSFTFNVSCSVLGWL